MTTFSSLDELFLKHFNLKKKRKERKKANASLIKCISSYLLNSKAISLSVCIGCWSLSCRLSVGLMRMRWRFCVESCRVLKRRITVSSSCWLRIYSFLQRLESKPVYSTRSHASPMRTWSVQTLS